LEILKSFDFFVKLKVFLNLSIFKSIYKSSLKFPTLSLKATFMKRRNKVKKQAEKNNDILDLFCSKINALSSDAVLSIGALAPRGGLVTENRFISIT